jgi:hypothetical protein
MLGPARAPYRSKKCAKRWRDGGESDETDLPGRSVLIQAVQGVDGEKTAALLKDPEREFVAASFLQLEFV